MAAIQTPGEGEGVEGYQGEGETGEPGKIDPKKWFRENRVWTAELEGIIDRDMIEIEEFMGMDDAELNEIANDDLKITNKLKRRRFVKAVRDLERKRDGGVRRVVFKEGDPDYDRKLREFARKGEKVDVVVLSTKETRLMTELERKRETLKKLVEKWSGLDEKRAKRKREELKEKQRMIDEIDAMIGALTQRKKKLTDEVDAIINESDDGVQRGVTGSLELAEKTDSAIKEIDSLAKKSDLNDREREIEVTRICKGVMDQCHQIQNELNALFQRMDRGNPFRFVLNRDQWIQQIQSCGDIVKYMQPVDLSVEKGVLKWKLPDMDDFKSDDTIQYEIISNGSESLGTTIQNQMKLTQLKPNERYSIQVRSRRNSKNPWGPLSQPCRFETDWTPTPSELKITDGVLQWKLSREWDFKLDDPIQFQVIGNGDPVGDIIQNEMQTNIKKWDGLKWDNPYSFQVKARLNSKNPWGELSQSIAFQMESRKVNGQLFDSMILRDQSLINWLIKEIGRKMTVKSANLIYRATRDGWTGKDAHSRIDGKGPTFVLMKSEHNHVYGGFTTVKWKSSGGYKSDPNAFIFLLKGKQSILQKYNVTVPRAFQLGGAYSDKAVCHHSSSIVFFGGRDLYVGPNCHRDNNAKTDFSFSYQMDPSNPSAAKDHCDLIGGHEGVNTRKKFKMIEIEYFFINSL